MRITHYLRRVRISDGGVCRAVLDMCRYQAMAGADVTLATLDDKDVPQAWKGGTPRTPKVKVLQNPGPFLGVFGNRFRKHVEPVVRESDALHMHDMWDPVQVSFTRAAKDLGKPYVQTPHGMMADWSVLQKKTKKAIYLKLFGREVIDNAAFIHTTAKAELEQSQKRHPRTPGVVIPLVFDLDEYREAPMPGPARANLPMPGDDVPSLLYLSRLHYKKRPDLLIRAGAALRDRGLKFNIVIGGPSDSEYLNFLQSLAKELKLEDRTTFLGMVPAEYKPSVYAACDLFVLPTHMENFGFVYFESLACATPLVTTKGTDTWKELEESGGGRIVGHIQGPEGDRIDELVKVLAELVQDRPRLKPMGLSGRRWVFEHLEPSVVVKQYLDLYQRAIEDRA